jgi:sn-glycerol 3-phosphate transport system ATP-binding protein
VLQQVGPPGDIYAQPANLFVAGFIGSPPMNTLTGRVAGDDGLVSIETAGGRIPLGPPQQAAVVASGAANVVVGVRPERVQIRTDGPLPATVVVIESLGYEHLVICRLSDGSQVVVRITGEQTLPHEGDAVRLGADIEHLHLFDAATGERIER